ncbi:elongation factor Ts [bacterium]|nr:elongation factor Ts [bacterium]
MSISAQDVKALREKTGAGMMDCKKALSECKGDFDEAIKYLREKGMFQARKRMDRTAEEGLIQTYISSDRKTAAIVELNCETDFVAKTDDFQKLAGQISTAVAVDNPAPDAWQSMKIENSTVGDSLIALTAKLGENIQLRRFKRYESKNGIFDAYVHAGSKLAVLIELKISQDSLEAIELGHDLAMQVAAANPIAVRPEEITSEEINKELEIYRIQARNEGKPEKVIDIIAEGRLNKYYQDVCLLEQPFVKEQKIKVKEHIAAFTKETGIEFDVIRFDRFGIGGN